MRKQKTDLEKYYFFDFISFGFYFLTSLMLGVFLCTKSFSFGIFVIFDLCLSFVFGSRSDYYFKKCYQLREDLHDEKKND